MSLKTFHIVFITLSTALLCFFAGWLVVTGIQAGNVSSISGGIASLLAAAGLVVYGMRFLRKLRHISYL
jgi:hypothetical protein